jgi:tetratricopeptide (TPR) repeat protein
MQHKHRHKRENWRTAGVTAWLAASAALAVGSAFAVTSSEVPPRVMLNRFAGATPRDSNPPATEQPVAPLPAARQFDSVIDRLLAPATVDFGDESTVEVEPSEIETPVEEVAPESAEPESPSPAEPQAELEVNAYVEPVAESVAESSEPPSTPWEASEPPAESAASPADPHSEPWQPDSAPSEAWTSEAWTPAEDIRPLPPEPQVEMPEPAAETSNPAAEMPSPPAEMTDEIDAVWSEEFDAAPEPSYRGAAAMPYSPTVAELSLQLLPSVRKAYGLAQHGAVYAARTEFIQVLRRIAQSKDAAEGVDEHSRALAVGLRSLDEADDFVPQGTQLEGELDVPLVASAHRTPVLGAARPDVRPDEAIASYHQFAREQLAYAVHGERAGSMALYGLGKVQNRLAFESDGELRHERKALVMFQAALDSEPSNHLAANEIGVLFARGGQPIEAAAMFRRAIDVTPTSTSYHNLAVAERSMGQNEQAAANERFAQYLAARDRAAGTLARRSGIEWVSPQDLSRVAQPLPIPGENQRVANDPNQSNDPRQTPRQPAGLPSETGPVETVAKWPQKLVPGIFRR